MCNNGSAIMNFSPRLNSVQRRGLRASARPLDSCSCFDPRKRSNPRATESPCLVLQGSVRFWGLSTRNLAIQGPQMERLALLLTSH